VVREAYQAYYIQFRYTALEEVYHDIYRGEYGKALGILVD
jgi:hypothetical protein